jgi:hypothetical protein
MVIVRNKQLLVFPIFISLATAVIVLFFFAPAVLWPTGHSYFTGEHWSALFDRYFTKTGGHGSHDLTASPVAIVYFVFLYLISMFTATFFNVAFYNEILAALNGQEVSLGRGLRFACTRWKAIVMWAVFAGLIGLIIKAIERRSGIIGKIIARFVGVAWSIASVFVIPIIVRDEESANPFVALRKSAEILKQTWGESLIGYIGIGFINSVVVIGSMMTLGVSIFATAQLHQPWLVALEVAAWLMFVFCWSYLMNVANLVYKGALYLYAAEGKVCDPYDQDLLDSAWKFKS